MTKALLPGNATPWEGAAANALAPTVAATSAIGAMRRIKYVSPRPSMLPFLVWELGLGELTPYVPNLYNLIDEGVRWQRLRGTVSAVAIGLAWVSYSATVEPAWTGRRWWNSFQLRFDALPIQDVPDLERIEGIAALSVPKRSQLRRGVFGYDVEAAQANHSRWNRAMWNFESGIRTTPANTLWSFGRTHEFEHLMTQEEGESIGNWLEPTDNTGIKWSTLQIPWVDATFPWAATAETQRQAVLSGWFAGQVLWARLSDEDGEVIGYRRCRAVRQVSLAFGGTYSVGASSFSLSASGNRLYVEAMTQFGDADGVLCEEVALMVGAELADGVKPGVLWAEPDQITGGTAIAVQEVSIPLRRTVREQFKFALRFDNPPDPALRFARSSNSQYLPLLEELELVFQPSLNLSNAMNSQYLPLMSELN